MITFLVLAVWPVLAVVLALVIGRGIAIADDAELNDLDAVVASVEQPSPRGGAHNLH